MESKIDQRESARRLLAHDPRETRSRYRSQIEEMVRDQEPKVRSLMIAYRLIGRAVGKSATTVRRVIAGHSISLDPETLHACDVAYAAHLTRIEQKAIQIAAAAERNKRKADAHVKGSTGPSSGILGVAAQPHADVDRSDGRP